jgi:hydroxyacylglutathione hydrolase
MEHAMEIEVIETPELGNRSYLIHDGDQAVVIDPQRDRRVPPGPERQGGLRGER